MPLAVKKTIDEKHAVPRSDKLIKNKGYLMLAAKIFVRLKPNVLDPQGKAVSNSLHQLGYSGVVETRISKYIEITFDSADLQAVSAEIERICKDLLANPNTETYDYTLHAMD